MLFHSKSVLLRLLCSGALTWAMTGSAKEFNVREFGAKGDGIHFDTAAIQRALDACADSGGTVEFPAGTYLSKPLTLHSQTTVKLDAGATLQAGTNQSDFMKQPGDWLKATRNSDFIPFIGGKHLTNVTLTGGVIDGGGAAWWGEAEKARRIKPGYTLPRPNLIALEQGKNLCLKDITLQNSPKFHFVPGECEGVVISNVTVLAPVGAANTDALDPSGCKDVLITKCHIDVGDDNVCIKAGKKVAGREFASEDITVTDCVFLHGHGVSIGGETAGGVHNVTVKNCTFENTDNGIRIKSQPGKGGLVENLVYDGITMKNVDPAITLTCYYANNSSGDAVVAAPSADTMKITERIPVYRNIRISNLTATCPREAGIIAGLPGSPITGVVLENVKISAAKSFEIRNAKGIELKNVTVTVPNGEPFKLDNAQVDGLNPN
jgi:polygalacturonase